MRISDWSSDVCSSDLGLGYIPHAQRSWNTDRIYNQQLENAVRQFQRESHIEETGVMDLATRQLLNELATTSGFAPTTEFDRAENCPPAPPPYTRAEYQLDRSEARRVGNEGDRK